MRSDLIAQINTVSLIHNLNALRAKCAPGVRFCAPLKADAYGHGVRIVAPALQSAGVDFAIVATVREAIELRDIGWTGEILLLGNVLAISEADEQSRRIEAMIEHRLTATIADFTGLQRIESARPCRPIPVHLKVDTGMGRMGVLPSDAEPLAAAIAASNATAFRGVYSHFATADFELKDLAQKQLGEFHGATERVRRYGDDDFMIHLANSAATITMPNAHFNMVRPGIALYGYAPAGYMRSQINLRPILRLVSHVVSIKTLPAGHCVGYGQTFTTTRTSRIGIIPVGYFDGFLRRLSNNSIVGTSCGSAPVVGRISMDQMAVDLTELDAIEVGAQILLIDSNPMAENSVESIATRLDTISYEVSCMLGPRIDRVQYSDTTGW